MTYVPLTTEGDGAANASLAAVPTIVAMSPEISGNNISSNESDAAPPPGRENVLSIPVKTNSYACGFV